MLRLRSDDDLFKSSTMSFGEHLEELRAALFRALAGLVVALAIAFPIADNAVRLIEGPLKRGLEKHYRHLAVDELRKSSAGPELLSEAYLVHEQKLAPRRVRIDRAAVRSSLQGDSGLADPTWTIAAVPLGPQVSVAIARRLVEASTLPEESVEKTIWSQLSAATQQEIQAIAQDVNPTRPANANQTAVAAALDECLRSESLARYALRHARWPDLPAYIEAVRDRLQDELARETGASAPPRSSAIQQLNRILLSATFPEAIPWPVPDTVEVTIWEPGYARIQTLGVPEAFLVWMKAWMVLAVILASPWIFFQLWMFVAAGLYGHERKLVYTFVPVSVGLFLAGAALAFCFVFDPVLDFLFQYNRRLHISIEPRFSDWIGFVLLLPLGFGISFQLPLVMLAVERFGIVTPDSYTKRWRIAVLLIFVIAMVLTPADPISMLLMAIPLTALYFGGILLCRYVPHGHAPAAPLGRDP